MKKDKEIDISIERFWIPTSIYNEPNVITTANPSHLLVELSTKTVAV